MQIYIMLVKAINIYCIFETINVCFQLLGYIINKPIAIDIAVCTKSINSENCLIFFVNIRLFGMLTSSDFIISY